MEFEGMLYSTILDGVTLDSMIFGCLGQVAIDCIMQKNKEVIEEGRT